MDSRLFSIGIGIILALIFVSQNRHILEDFNQTSNGFKGMVARLLFLIWTEIKMFFYNMIRAWHDIDGTVKEILYLVFDHFRGLFNDINSLTYNLEAGLLSFALFFAVFQWIINEMLE